MILRITIENYKCIASMEVRPNALTVLSGGNEVGKSSFLEALTDLFEGGHRPQRIRHGAKKARIEIELDNGVLIEKSITPKSTAVKITDESGAEVKSPQAYLNRLATGFGLDPLAIMTAKPKDRAAFLLEAMPIQFRRDAISEVFDAAPGCTNLKAIRATETLADAPEIMDIEALDALRDSIYKRRTRHNVLAKDADSTVSNLRKALPSDAGEDIDWKSRAKLLEQEVRVLESDLLCLISQGQYKLQTEIQQINHERDIEIQKIRDRADQLVGNAREKEREEELHLRDQAAPVIQAKHDEVTVASRNAEDQIRVQSLKEQIERERQKAGENSMAADRLTDTLEAIDEYKKRRLADSPLEGIEVRDGDIFVNGVSFDECNTATQMLACFRIAALKRGELGFMIADRAESLDDHAWEMFQEAAIGSGYQVIAARVDGTKPLTVETFAKV